MESVGRGTTKMPQFCLQLAGLSVSVASQYSQVEHMCSGYEVPKGASSDIDVRIDPQDIDAERDEGAWSDAYLETLAVYRQIAEALPAFDRMLVHGALLSFQGEGYLFAAPSGTGKSTHALLWRCGQYRQWRQAHRSPNRRGRRPRSVRHAVGGQRRLA